MRFSWLSKLCAGRHCYAWSSMGQRERAHSGAAFHPRSFAGATKDARDFDVAADVAATGEAITLVANRPRIRDSRARHAHATRVAAACPLHRAPVQTSRTWSRIMGTKSRAYAVITGASSGIGLELARLCARQGYDVLIGADQPAIQNAATALRQIGTTVDAVQSDLSTLGGVDALLAAVNGRTIDACSRTPAMGSAMPFSTKASNRSDTSSTPTSPGRSTCFIGSDEPCASAA